MAPASFTTFFTVSATAVASLIGLLFVAVSVAPGRTVGKGAPASRRAVAENAFTTLLNAFLVSLIALLPTAPLSLGVLVVTGSTLVGSLRTLVLMIVGQRKSGVSWANLLRQLMLPVSMLVVLGFEFAWGISVYGKLTLSADEVGTLAVILIVLEGLAIVRAWELIGAQRNSLFGLLGWLEPPEEDGETNRTTGK
jgi:hypothetical protein